VPSNGHSYRDQCAPACPTRRRTPSAQLRIPLLGLGVGLGDRLLSILKAELQLFLRQTLRLRTELHTVELQQQMLLSFEPFQQPIAFRRQRIAL